MIRGCHIGSKFLVSVRAYHLGTYGKIKQHLEVLSTPRGIDGINRARVITYKIWHCCSEYQIMGLWAVSYNRIKSGGEK